MPAQDGDFSMCSDDSGCSDGEDQCFPLPLPCECGKIPSTCSPDLYIRGLIGTEGSHAEARYKKGYVDATDALLMAQNEFRHRAELAAVPI